MAIITGNLWLRVWCRGCRMTVVCRQQDGGIDGRTVWYCPECELPVAVDETEGTG